MSVSALLIRVAGTLGIAGLLLAGPHLDSASVWTISDDDTQAGTTAQPLPAGPALPAQGTTPPNATGNTDDAAAAKGVAQLRSIESANSTQPAARTAAGFLIGEQP